MSSSSTSETERPDLTTGEILSAAVRFSEWLDASGLESFDPYDIWGTRYGLWSRRMYYRHGNAAAPLIAPLVAMDVVWPGLRRLFVRKQRFATADAQVVLAFLNLYRVTGERRFLTRAITIGDEILGYSIAGYRGPCWGYPFDWQNGKGATWWRNTPYITCTPYCYEAYLGLHAETGDRRYLGIMRGIAEFVAYDLRDTPHGQASDAGSYSPHDNSKVVNASAYRAWLLIDAGVRFNVEDFTRKGMRNLEFVLETQREDGSWLYAVDAGASFIDNFHTCFNLKNLLKIDRLVPSGRLAAAIRAGFQYYLDHLLHDNGDPKSFAKEPRLQLTRLEMYNFAEGITLCSLLADRDPRAQVAGRTLLARLIRDFQLPAGYFVTRVFRSGAHHTFPFLRWPQAQLFLAVTNALQVHAAEGPVRSSPGEAVAR